MGCDLTYKTLLYLPKIKVMIAFNPTYYIFVLFLLYMFLV